MGEKVETVELNGRKVEVAKFMKRIKKMRETVIYMETTKLIRE